MKYVIERNNELYHYGIKGMKWGVHRFYNADGSRTAAGKKREKKAKQSYEDKVRTDMETYNKLHPERSKKDNYTIALRKEARNQAEKYTKRGLAAMALMPVAGLGFPVMMGSMYVAQKRGRVLEDIMDEYNIENAKRVLNM